ncbi:putative keratinocyte-associated protein [Helianthus annuus]|nr:putative keratinocyte-associated protein [Helianthus annuus]KAJ0577473.1 putative keratinocyte-associated protein [Helianthus annuus]KAJ0584940.1 putative keratinocyte-associated protein [Helianthus annuus]KAJ0750605.1 putative keratinocyte-associated protein [Helianthus annuus]KAJ0789546.1 putative keratinocyte-associated protein [Helianthus annuus]
MAAEAGNSMLYSLLLFVVTLSLQEMYRGKLASSELFTILGGFTSSLVFLFLLTFIGNYQETYGVKTGWGAVILAEVVALVAAGTVHRVCITTCFLFSAVMLYEVKKISEVMVSKSEAKGRRH